MSPESSSSGSKTCPTCGTRLSENATRCLVCGRTFTTTTKTGSTKTGSPNPVQSPKLPELKLSLPAAIGLVVLVLGLGAGMVYFLLQTTGRVTTPTVTPTITVTPTSTSTPLPTLEPTLAATPTALPPLEYVVKIGDFCSSIAAIYKISVQSIVDLNRLPPDCGVLYENQKILIPIPTPTASPAPTSTLSAGEATSQACGVEPYTVKAGDTLSSISLNYNISIESIKSFNNMTSETVFDGMRLSLPLCERRPTQGPTPTPTLPPPYPQASLLLPTDGTVYTSVNDSIVLQWASVGTLRENEAYAITVEDVTAGGERRTTQYTRDTKFIVPANIRPLDNTSHIFRWWVVAVRQTGTTIDGQPTYAVYGQISINRVFGWSGTGTGAIPTP